MGKQTEIRTITDIRNKLLEFNKKTKGNENLFAISMYLDIDSFDSNGSETKFKSKINQASRNKVDFPEGLDTIILKNYKRFFIPENYDNQAKSLFYYASYNSQTGELDEELIFSKIPVNEYLTIGQNFDISILDEHIFLRRERLILEINSEETKVYAFKNYTFEKVAEIKNKYVEDKIDIYTIYSQDIVSQVTKILSKEKYFGIYIFSKSDFEEILEKNLRRLSRKVDEYVHCPEYIDIDGNLNLAIEKTESLIRDYRQKELEGEISSAREEGLLLTDEKEIIDAANEARIEKLLIANEKQGPVYIKNLLSNYPAKGSSRINSMKNEVATKVYEYGGVVATLPSKSKEKIVAILRRRK